MVPVEKLKIDFFKFLGVYGTTSLTIDLLINLLNNHPASVCCLLSKYAPTTNVLYVLKILTGTSRTQSSITRYLFKLVAEALTNNYPAEFDIEISCRNRPTR